MNTYFSTFITGFADVIKENLLKMAVDIKIVVLLDGLVVYKTKASPSNIKKIRFFNNSFLLTKIFKDSSLDLAADKFIGDKRVQEQTLANSSKLGRTFRIIFSKENQIVNKNKLEELEKILSRKMLLDRANPDVELWFLERSEGDVFLGIRLTRPLDSEKYLKKGELRSELAYLLCLLSEPSAIDHFLDPFAGSGAIVLERAKRFPFKKIFAGELDKYIFKKLQEKLNADKDITLGRWDATDLSSLTENSINKIVTDPPWGFYRKASVNLPDFYKKMLNAFSRVMQGGGIVVILMGQKEIFESVLGINPNFVLVEKIDSLVSGKKASIYKLLHN
jgi:tRNA G10  N-methylase Trm11